MKNVSLSLLMAAAMSCSALAATPGEALKKPTVVLVHGAFADGSAWNKVIPLLEAKGLDVIAVQDPLTTLSDDVATTRRALARVKGPIVLVGHSYGGAVITEAGANNDNVKALVYVAAFAPSVGETVSDLNKNYPVASGFNHIEADDGGYLKLTREGVAKHLAQDVSADQAALMYATQKPTNGAIFGEKITDAAWEKKPSWYIVSLQDHMLNTDLQKAMAKKIHANVTTLDASHAPHISQPDAVANVILDAVNTLK
ncbi:alpha/beta fold hydrolase [Enterobacter sp. RHBSTW-00175]|uniref:alpha/beta fold hydrolase n=1 Tax=Enterobacter sp. RHBSTW-00175 TaxID=2742639 RepID=UPI0015E9AF82|nr:alpha/beta hydrolase [Enterobacter sp. RHBSTW-00175]QMR78235.1 alpha/beta hydrolase [Enterobacter sp. RHBSTW-00175]